MHEPESTAVEVDQLPLKAMGLKPGMALQTRRLVEGASKTEAQYYGAIESKGVMVAGLGNAVSGLHMGEICVVRGFTGQFEFSFVSKVLQTFEKPFAYALLAYPSHVDARKVRQSLRTRVSWPCTVVAEAPRNPGDALAAATTANLVDLSPFGAMIRMGAASGAGGSSGSIGPIGSYIALSIHAEIESAALELRLRAKICHNNRAPDSDDFLIGMEFAEISGSDRQWLVRLAQQH